MGSRNPKAEIEDLKSFKCGFESHREHHSLFQVTCYKLAEELFDVAPGPDYPFRKVENPEQYLADLKERIGIVDPADPKLLFTLRCVADKIHDDTQDMLCERYETFGTFLTFEEAERYVAQGSNDWDECGWFNVARIAEYREGLTAYQLPTCTWWYKIPKQEREHDKLLTVEKIEPPKRFKGRYYKDTTLRR